ncbi:MAG: DUF1365 domain-containing protein, partial [Solirubrobacterales bacterium]|nr:DUF1365 domain-containing protein [Solirubrobacterales bacterium]
LVARRPGPLRFRRRHYLGDAGVPLERAVRDRVAADTGVRPRGPIRVLTQLSSFGHCFNPVSFYYCFEDTTDRLESVVAEVTNTPWGERHAYVLGGPDERRGVLTGEFDKALHVSPFMDMDHRYLVHASTPSERLSVHIESRHPGGPAFEAGPARRPPEFEATLALRRTELTRRAAATVTRRYPVAGARVLGLIYGHALGLKLAGAAVHPHPGSGPRPHQLTGQEPV